MRAALKPYPAYKDSGALWLDAVPQHWDLRRAKTVLRERVEKGHPDEPLLAATQTKGVVRKEQYENRTVLAINDLHLLKLVHVGDFVISLRSFQGGIEYARDRGIISPAYTVLYPNRPESHGYLAWLFKSTPYLDNLKLHVTGIRQGQNIDFEKLSRSILPLPPHDEQIAIERFLGYVDRRIRRYIRAKQNLIKLLEEERRAILELAVTRGLDPKVRLKHTSSVWFREVPEHWELVPFKRRVGFQEGPGIMATDFRDIGVPLLRISCLRGDLASLDGCNYLDPEMVARKWKHFEVCEGDYLLSASASTGSVALATQTVAGSIPYTGIIRLWPVSPKTFMPFVKLFIECRAFQDQIDAAKSGVGIEHFGPSHLKRMFITLPPASEQREIVRQVEELSAPIVDAIKSAHDGIALVREYRAALIADVVTGKLDVRDAATKIPDEPDTLGNEGLLVGDNAGDAAEEVAAFEEVEV